MAEIAADPAGRPRGGDRRRRRSWATNRDASGRSSTRRSRCGSRPDRGGGSARSTRAGWIDFDRATSAEPRVWPKARSRSTLCSRTDVPPPPTAGARDPLNGVRPGGGRRSWWLREALAAEPAATRVDAAAPPLAGAPTADVAILGGGYTGLWTAWHLAEQSPGLRVAILEPDICGGGPSGRNGGFVTGWWDELPTLVERHGEAEGAADRPRDRRRGRRDRARGATGTASTPGTARPATSRPARRPPRTAAGEDAVAACRRLGVGEEYVAVDADRGRGARRARRSSAPASSCPAPRPSSRRASPAASGGSCSSAG